MIRYHLQLNDETIQDGTLQDKITKMAAVGDRLSEHELIRIFRGICMGVRHLHQCSVCSVPGPALIWLPLVLHIDTTVRVSRWPLLRCHQLQVTPLCHRDLKPGNVLLTPQGDPVLMDFGSMQRVSAKGALRDCRGGHLPALELPPWHLRSR